MSFGVSISDFILAFEILTSLRRRFVQAPQELREMTVEIRNLSSAFRDIDDILEEVGIPPERKQRLLELSKDCRTDLDSLQRLIKEYPVLNHGKRKAERARSALKRLQWPKEDIEKFRQQLSKHVQSLNAFLARETLHNVLAVSESVTEIREIQERQNRETVLKWLSPVDFTSQQQDLFELRQEKYGHWFLDSSEYQAFVEEKGATLYCYGGPGTGKTLISATVIDNIEKRFHEDDEQFGLAYIYCSYHLQQDQQPEDLLRCILRQFVERISEIPITVYDLYEENRTRKKPTSQQVLGLLPIVLQSFDRSFIVLDALDEFYDANNGTERFLDHIFNLQSLVQMNILATSRPVTKIEQQFEHRKNRQKKEIRAENEEIGYYIQDRMGQLQRPLLADHPEVKAAAKERVTAAADGMFLLARLHMDTIMRQPTLGDLKHAIDALPQGVEGLDRTYDEAMARIRAQEKSTQWLAETLLVWATFAWRALTSAEVQHALSIRPGMKRFDDDFIPDTAFLGSICAGLIEIDKESGTVRLVHHTTRDYFIRNNVFPNAMKDIARSCLTYISFDDFASGPCLKEEELSARLQRYPLYSYAALFWSYHARKAESAVRELESALLQDDARLFACVQVVDALENTKGFTLPSHGETDLQRLERIHVAAGLGLVERISTMLRHDIDPDARDANDQTPLIWAAANGHVATVRILMSMSARRVDINAKDRQNLTPLCHAAQRGHFDAVELLTTSGDTDIEIEDERGRTALLLAAVNGHEAVAKLLISRKANIEKADHVRRNVLHYAAILGMTQVLELLAPLQDLEALSINMYTPLLYAAENAHADAIEILLRHGANAKHRNERGNGCLHLALKPPLLVVKTFHLLLEHADVNDANSIGQTPLHRAVVAPWLDHFKVLVACGADISAEDKQGRNVMHLAASGCSTYRLGQFLEISEVQQAGIVLSTDGEGRNALHHALRIGHSAANNAEVLLAYGVDSNQIDRAGDSPLSAYIQASIPPVDLRLCKMLLEHGGHAWRNAKGQNLIDVAAARSQALNEPLIELLQSQISDSQHAIVGEVLQGLRSSV